MKKNKPLIVICIIVMAAVILAGGCGGGADKPKDDKKVYELTLAVQHPMEAPMMSVVNTAWKNWIEKESGGRIKIKFLPSEQAAKAPELYDAARTGIADIACQMIPACPGRFPLTEVTQLPLIFEYPGSRAAALTTMALYKKYPEIQAEHKNVKVLGFHANGLAHIHTVKKQVRTMEDLKGMVIETLAGKYGVATLQKLGAIPETLLPGEMYDAMAKGVIDGNALEWEGQFVWKLNEQSNYSTQVGLFLSTFVHVMNLDTWNSLPPDLQKLFIEDNGEKHYLAHGYNFDKDDIAYERKLDEIYKSRNKPGVYVLPAEEKAKWLEAVKPVHEEWVKAAAAKVGEEKARAILEDAKKYAREFGGYPDEKAPEGAKILREWGAPGY